jgi:hypothetical protein
MKMQILQIIAQGVVAYILFTSTASELRARHYGLVTIMSAIILWIIFILAGTFSQFITFFSEIL